MRSKKEDVDGKELCYGLKHRCICLIGPLTSDMYQDGAYLHFVISDSNCVVSSGNERF